MLASSDGVRVLSHHQFLTFSIAAFLREQGLNWVGMLMADSWIVAALHLRYYSEEMGLTYPDRFVNYYGCFMSDVTLMVISLFDILNLKVFKIQDDRDADTFRNSLHTWKFILLVVLAVSLKDSLPTYFSTYGYVWYTVCCVFSALVVFTITWFPAEKWFPSKPVRRYFGLFDPDAPEWY